MTNEEKNLMRNPEHKPLMDLPPVIQHLMQENKEHLLWLTADGGWTIAGSTLYRGSVYTVCATAAVEPPPPVYKQYPTFCGTDRIHKADMTKPDSDKKCIRYLTTLMCMDGFAGIRYKGSPEWRETLNLLAYGYPVEVRFRVR